MSHEFRTPLGGILGFAELLQSGAYSELNEGQEHAVNEIVMSVDYLSDMVSELLDEAQIQANKTILQSKPFSPRDLLRQAIASMEILAENKGLAFNASIDPALPHEIYGDERRLLQILINLIGNAIKFTANGYVNVSIQNSDERHWCIEVTDSGTGIAEEDCEMIFEPFSQGQTSTSTKHRGIGLGLTITKQLVELMGGKILLESQVGQGSTFKVILPMLKIAEVTV